MQLSFNELSFLPEDTRASLFPRPGSEEAREMTATSGLRCLELSESAGRLGCLQRMLLGTSRWVSTRCWLTWKAKTTPQGRLLFQLVPRTHHTDEIESGLWATPTANPSIAASMEALKKEAKRLHPRGQYTLGTQMAERMWATPTAQDAKNNGGPSQMERNSLPLNAEVGGSLNPEWVEWLMGYSPGWTDCEGLETPLSQESPMKSSGQ